MMRELPAMGDNGAADLQTSAFSNDGRISPERNLVVIQRNPTSGSGGGKKQLRLLISELRKANFRVRLFANRERFDRFVQQASPDVYCLVAAGGDGTIGSLVNRHAQFPIATLPMGTENLMARHLQILRCGRTLAEIIRDGRTRCFDTGMVNGQRFLLMCSVGIDADVVQQLHARRTGNIRHSTYLKPIFQSFVSYSFPMLSVYSPEGDLLSEGTHVIATNIPEYGFRMPFCPEANGHDGLLDVRVFKPKGTLTTLRHAIRTRLGFADRASDIHRFHATDIEVRSESVATMAQCDGDPAGAAPVRIDVDPSSMTLIVGQTFKQ